MANWYIGSDKYAAVAQRANSTAYVSTSNGGRGDYVRAVSPNFDGERVYRCTTSGTSGASPPATFTTGASKGATVSDGTVTWTECTGNATDNETSNAWKAPAARAKHILESWASPGDRLYQTTEHDETVAAALSWTYNGTAAAPIEHYCVDGGVAPPMADTWYPNNTLGIQWIVPANFNKKIATTGANNITLGGYAMIYGPEFAAGSSSSTADLVLGNGSAGALKFVSCKLGFNNTSGSSRIQATQPLTEVTIENCQFTFLSGSQQLNLNGGNVKMKNCLRVVDPNGNTPSTLIGSSGNLVSTLEINGANFAVGSAMTVIAAGVNCPRLVMRNIRRNANVTMAATPTVPAYGDRDVILVDSALTNYVQERTSYYGTIVQELTKVARPTGAADETNTISWKMVSSANTSWTGTLKSFPITSRRQEGQFAIMAEIDVLTDGVTLDDHDIWVEVEYLGSDLSPLSMVNSSRALHPNELTVDLPTSDTVWITSGLSSPVKQKIQVSVAPSADCYVRLTVHLARASTTVYVNPKIAWKEFVYKPKNWTWIVWDQPGTNMATWVSHGTTVNGFSNYNGDSQTTADWISTTVAGGAKYAHNAKGPGGAPSAEPDSPGWLAGEPANEAADSNCFGLYLVDEPDLGHTWPGWAKLCCQEWRATGTTKPILFNNQGVFIANRSGWPRGNPWLYSTDLVDWPSGDDYAFDDGHQVMYTGDDDSDTPYTNTFVGRQIDMLKNGISGWAPSLRGRVYGPHIRTATVNGNTHPEIDPNQVRFIFWSSVIHGASFTQWFPLQNDGPGNFYNSTPANVYTEIDTLVANMALLGGSGGLALFDQTNGGRSPYQVRYSANSTDADGISAASYLAGTAAPTWSAATGTQMAGGWEAAIINGSDGNIYWIVLNMLNSTRSLTDTTFGLSSVSFGGWGVKCYKNGVLTNIFS